MSSLVQIQEAFTKALLNPATAVPPAVRGSARGTADRRLAVYRNNVAAGLIGALATRFPVVQRLVGGDFFREMARLYATSHPPRSPIMMYYGETFPAFIEGFEPAAPIPYLGDIARIEMARGLAYHAADAVPVGVSAFSAPPLDRLAEQRVVLHPSVSIVSSAYPVYSIWRVNQSRAPVVPVSPWAGEAALIARPLQTVEVRKLNLGDAAFLRALAEGSTFADAAASGADAESAFNVAQSLAVLIQARIVVGFGGKVTQMKTH